MAAASRKWSWGPPPGTRRWSTNLSGHTHCPRLGTWRVPSRAKCCWNVRQPFVFFHYCFCIPGLQSPKYLSNELKLFPLLWYFLALFLTNHICTETRKSHQLHSIFSSPVWSNRNDRGEAFASGYSKRGNDLETNCIVIRWKRRDELATVITWRVTSRKVESRRFWTYFRKPF